jgi:hypothetical protein
MENKRKSMCKSCIYRCKLAKGHKHILKEHACHEVSSVACAGSLSKLPKIEVESSIDEELEWQEMQKPALLFSVCDIMIRHKLKVPIDQKYYKVK